MLLGEDKRPLIACLLLTLLTPDDDFGIPMRDYQMNPFADPLARCYPLNKVIAICCKCALVHSTATEIYLVLLKVPFQFFSDSLSPLPFLFSQFFVF